MLDPGLVLAFVAAVVLLVATPGPDGPIGLLAGRIGAFLSRHRNVARRVNIITGSLFVGLSARLALTH